MTTPLILLPGMMCDERLFAPQAAQLPVIVLPIGQADSMSALAKSVLDAAPERFALGGLSMGGIVAMEVIRQAPDRVAGIALMDTNPLAELPDVQARRGPQMAKASSGALLDVMRDEMKPNYLTDGPKRAEILDLCMTMAMDLGPDVFINQSKALRDRPDQSKILRAFAKPALVMCGSEDKLCPVARHELMHQLMPQSTLRIIENAGHLPTLEQPQQATEALRAWLQEID